MKNQGIPTSTVAHRKSQLQHDVCCCAQELTPCSSTIGTYDTESPGVALCIPVRVYAYQDTGENGQDDEFTSRTDEEGDVRQAVSSKHIKLVMGLLTVMAVNILSMRYVQMIVEPNSLGLSSLQLLFALLQLGQISC